jgi:aminoglycoside phosphotransferase (APT) family kinase protein
VQALLRHLGEVGFTGSPRVIGSAGDEHVVTYIEGTFVHPHAWSDEGVWQVGKLLRDLHTATATFRLPPDAVWERWWMHNDGPESVITHCDAGPWHIVARDGLPVGLIDWELAGPAHRLDEVAATAWWNAQLHDDDVAERQNLPDAEARARQLAMFLDGYELPVDDREGLVTRMIEVAIRTVPPRRCATGSHRNRWTTRRCGGSPGGPGRPAG